MPCHAQTLLDLEAQGFVELANFEICRSNLQIDLCAASGPQCTDGMTDKSRGQASTLMLGRDSHLVQPTAEAVLSRHRGADYGAIFHRNQQHVVLNGELGVEHFRWSVVRRVIGEDGFPQCNNAGTVSDGGGSYDHFLTYSESDPSLISVFLIGLALRDGLRLYTHIQGRRLQASRAPSSCIVRIR